MAMVNFIASVNDQNIQHTKAIVELLKKKGCMINDVFEGIGTISGSVDDKIGIDELKVTGIDAVEVQRKVKRYKKK
jgi:hypothetical protein